ncbi:hypothetical protein C8R44DRAFT_880464 [Mycena epipterygia]|nr:hypothetical protein C8R44DRAFT_880464 [Mycena epipterygia]
MSYVPLWSPYTLPGRGKLVLLSFDLVNVLEEQLQTHYEIETATVAVDHAISKSGDDKEDEMPLVYHSMDDKDDDYLPSSPGREGVLNRSPYKLRPRTLLSPSPSPSLTSNSPALPDVYTLVHLCAMGFRHIGWDDLRAFVDLQNRIGAFFVGPPIQRTTWERTIIRATEAMENASKFFDHTGIKDDTLRGGITYDPNILGRPQNIRNTPENTMTLAQLRFSEPIQEITSFQNAMLREIVPRLWDSANETIEALLDHDCRLRTPFAIPIRRPLQPTAFAEVAYQFSVPDSTPPRILGRRPSTGWDALSAVGHYDASEGELILWEDETIVRFPPGSTFFVPRRLLHFSFAAISEDSSCMFIMQSLNGDLYNYVEQGFLFDDDEDLFESEDTWKVERRARAESLIGKYPTVPEFDGDVYYTN